MVRCGEQVAHRVDTAALPCGTLEAAADRFDQPGVRVGDDETHTGQAAVGQRCEELAPERLVLGVADIEAEDLTMPVSTQSGGDHDRFRHDLAVFADMDVGRVEPHVDERLVIQPTGAQHVDVGVDLGADPRHRRLRDPRLAAECFDQVVDLPSGGAGDVRGHDHRPQRPVDPSAWLEQLREEAALAELGDPDLDITARCRDQLRAMPVALRHTLAGAFAWCGADRRGEFRFDQLLQRHSQDVAQRRRETGIGAEQTRGKVG